MTLRTKIGGRGVSALAIAISAFALPQAAFAQDAAPADEEASGEIIVTGFRASLESAVNKKKSADQIVESVSAEDIGKLPDASIAESIARLPGLTSQRLSGRSNSITIRGFAPDFSTTLLNGREQTSTGDNRAVEYDQYPSEMVSQVNVYKSPMASLVGQGLSGTVDLRTIRPLAAGKTIVSIGARGTYADNGKLNVDSNDKGFRVNGLVVTQLKDDTIGLAIGGSYVDEWYQTEEFNAWGYPTGPANNLIIGGSKSYVTSSRLKRLGLNGTLEVKLTPNLTSSIDAFYSDFKDDNTKRGIELPLWWSSASLSPGYSATNGFVTGGTYTGVKGVVRNDVFQRHSKLYSFGWNLDYKGDDGWDAMLDLSYSGTDRNELALESYSGTGRAGVGATDTLGFTSGATGTVFTHALNYGDYNTILLTSPQGWGGTQIAVNGTRIDGGQDGYYNDRIVEDKLYQARGQVVRHFDNGAIESVQLGMAYTKRSKSLVPDEYFLGLAANNTGNVSIPVPTQYRLGVTNLDFLGLGSMISYDPLALIRDGIYKLVPNPYGDVVVKSYSVEEKLMTGYLQANLKADVGSAQLTGNFGVQVIFTNQDSTGASAVYQGTNPNGSPNIGSAVRKASTDYVDVLPSLNLSLRFDSDFVIRFAAARELIRPRLDDMRASASFGYAFVGPTTVQVTGGSGNPFLRPWRANAVDLTFEKYFGTKGFVGLQFFYKDLKSYIYTDRQSIATSTLALPSPGTGITILPNADLDIPVNGKGGALYGVELAATLPFGELVPALDGFGITGGGSYTKTEIKPNPGAPAEDLPGYSKWVVNGTLFFEKGGFNVRGSMRYRSTFMGELSGFAANRVRRRAAPETIVDAQIGYDFQEGSALQGLSLYVQGQNLTDEPFVTTNPGDTRQVIDYQSYGRRFLAGFTYKF
ncbi:MULTISPECIES: TonB-dependent receptor [unclassified Novosphingobium]|uniref:TonB-dependent receptor n=1 Tax=unclassified Novosphingobium TaxID=2644732 RepID=UPI0025F0E78B|nr:MULTISPECIES: TonB-dependent receptor [unclassified Novosphingobium]HQV03211.1 TonB-dependent receptor [Novosphingobium sp.]